MHEPTATVMMMVTMRVTMVMMMTVTMMWHGGKKDDVDAVLN